MTTKHRLLTITSILSATSLTAILAQSGSPTVASGQREILLQATEAWNGKPYTHYPTGQPQLTTIKLTIAPHTVLPWHSHPYPNCGVCSLRHAHFARPRQRQDARLAPGRGRSRGGRRRASRRDRRRARRPAHHLRRHAGRSNLSSRKGRKGGVLNKRARPTASYRSRPFFLSADARPRHARPRLGGSESAKTHAAPTRARFKALSVQL